MYNKKLVLENGKVFEGKGFGSNTERVAELVYNTAVVGYQEALSDPSNLEYIMVMGYPVIGSYGLTDEDYESDDLTVSGLVVREYSKYPSNFRYTHELYEWFRELIFITPALKDIPSSRPLLSKLKNQVKLLLIYSRVNFLKNEK